MDIKVNINYSIKEVLDCLELNKKKFVIVVNDEEKVLFTITDGDLRRAFLKGFFLEYKIKDIELFKNKNFYYLNVSDTFEIVCEKFKNDNIEFLPILNKDKKLVNLITKKQFHLMLLENIDFDLNYDFKKLDNYILEHQIYNRPWGFYKSTILTSHAQSKIITVFPQGELSLQKHKRREEHWIIMKGKGKVILDTSLINVFPGKYIYIPTGCKHQIINDGDENLIFAEVQLGEYFGEDDIIRYSDKYGRK